MTLDEICGSTADPAAARTGMERVTEAAPGLDLARAAPLAHLFAGSAFLTDWLARRPEDLDWLTQEGVLDKPRGADEMASDLAALMRDADPVAALRIFKHRELCRICARELSGAAPIEESMSEWSAVADVALDAAIRLADAEAREEYGQPIYTELTDDERKVAGFAALGMGKLGGRELNISSDIDLVYIHTSDNGTTDGEKQIPLHEFFVRIARRVSRLLNEVTHEGFVFRVDLDLRPEGKAGEITNSVGAMEIYYESWGQLWERQALIKARHCGGDEAVSGEVLGRLHPFVYRKYLDQTALDEIASIKDRIDQALKAKKSARNALDDIKLGRGGIREIEFVTQALQLLYGARYPDLQTASTLKALDTLDSLGLISTPHHTDLKEAYVFYRKIENRIQYYDNRQTHLMPTDPARLETLGRQMGFDENPGASLVQEVSRRRVRVREIFDLFFFHKEKAAAEAFPVPLDDEDAMARWLDTMHFDHPRASARALNLLRNGSVYTHPSAWSRQAFDRFGPTVVSEAADTAWPDHVILGFSNFVEARGGRDMLYDLFDRQRPVIKLLAAIFSSSASLTAALLRQPDLLDRLIAADPVEAPPDRRAYKKEFAAARQKNLDGAEALALTNSFRTAESVRLGLRRILGFADRYELMKSLTMLAEEYLGAVVDLARGELAAEGLDGKGINWTMLAAGKMGRREMNFGSDMDLIVFYDEASPAGADAARVYVRRLTQAVIKLAAALTPYGAGYQVDMRLRPEGEAGPLAPPLSSAREYYQSRGRTWERLALVGARPIAGDRAFGSKTMDAINSFIFSAPPGPDDARSLMEIREKIASQKARAGTLDIKFGRGGLMEIEFICQWIAIEKKSLRRDAGPFVISTLRLAKEKSWLDAPTARELEKAYVFFRTIEDTLRMDREQAVNVIPKSDRILLKRLARAVEAPGGVDTMTGLVKETMAVVRDIYLRFFEKASGQPRK